MQAALLVLVMYYMGEFLFGRCVLFFVHYNGKCWYLPFVCPLPAHIMVDVDYDDPLVRAPGEKYPIILLFFGVACLAPGVR